MEKGSKCSKSSVTEEEKTLFDVMLTQEFYQSVAVGLFILMLLCGIAYIKDQKTENIEFGFEKYMTSENNYIVTSKKDANDSTYTYIEGDLTIIENDYTTLNLYFMLTNKNQIVHQVKYPLYDMARGRGYKVKVDVSGIDFDDFYVKIGD